MSAPFSTPYSRPQGQGTVAPVQEAIGPYVPRAVRGSGRAVAPLPWIDDFLTATPPAGSVVIPSDADAPDGTAQEAMTPMAEGGAHETLRWYRYDAEPQRPQSRVEVRVAAQEMAPAVEAPALAAEVRQVPEVRLQVPSPMLRRDTESAEAAAMALELLALRVRAGELPLSGYDPSMGDAAALVAALAAVLGVRLSD